MVDENDGVSLDENAFYKYLFLGEDEEEEPEDASAYKKWIYNNGEIRPVEDVKLFNKVRAGFYSVGYNVENRLCLYPEKINIDAICKLPDQEIVTLLDEISTFWDKKELFKAEGFVHKRGILLMGPPGTGKTSIVNVLSYDLIKKGGVVFHIKTMNDLKAYCAFIQNYFRKIEPDRNIITVIEDLDNIYHQDSNFVLSFLDGEQQIPHNVIIATTNRFDDLDDLILRPSRFDKLIEINNPKGESKRVFLKFKKLDDVEIEEWIKLTDDLSFAELKEVYIAYKLFGYSLKDAVSKVNAQKAMVGTTTFKSPVNKKTAGFSFSSRK